MPHASGMAGQVIHTMAIEFGHVCCLCSAATHGLFFRSCSRFVVGFMLMTCGYFAGWNIMSAWFMMCIAISAFHDRDAATL